MPLPLADAGLRVIILICFIGAADAAGRRVAVGHLDAAAIDTRARAAAIDGARASF